MTFRQGLQQGFRIVSVTALGAALAACGGGGDSTASPNGTTAASTPAPTGGTQTNASATMPRSENASFVNRAAALGFTFDFGFGPGLNPMVAQFAGRAA